MLSSGLLWGSGVPQGALGSRVLSSGLLWGASSAAGAGCAARRHKTTTLPLVVSPPQERHICLCRDGPCLRHPGGHGAAGGQEGWGRRCVQPEAGEDRLQHQPLRPLIREGLVENVKLMWSDKTVSNFLDSDKGKVL